MYGPLVYYWCRKFGLQPADAADAFQDAFAAVAKGFDEINAFAGAGQDKAVLTDAAVDLATYGPPTDIPLAELAQILWLNQFEKIELWKSGSSEKTDIDNIDAVFAWWE